VVGNPGRVGCRGVVDAFGRSKHPDTIRKVFGEESLCERGARFDEQVGDRFLVQVLEEMEEREPSVWIGGECAEVDSLHREGADAIGESAGAVVDADGGGALIFFEDPAVGGDAKGGVEKDAKLLGAGFPGDLADGKPGVIGEKRADADGDRVRAGAKRLHGAGGTGIGDLDRNATGAGDFVVGGLGPLEGDVGAMVKRVGDEGGDELFALSFQDRRRDFDSGLPQERQSFAVDGGVGIEAAGDDARDARFDELRDARGRFFIGVAAGFEGDVGSSALRGFDATGEGVGFGVRLTELLMISATDHATVLCDDAADDGVGLGATATVDGQAEGAADELFVGL